MNKELFWDRLRHHGDRPAVVTDRGEHRTYAELADDVDRYADELVGARSVVIVEATNSLDSLRAYLACLRAKHPVVLVEPGSTHRDDRIARAFAAAKVFRQSTQGRQRFESLSCPASVELHPDLCILLSTSGTTGSPKLVRLSRTNIESNAAAITNYLSITPDDRAVTTLPMYYSYGMSVVNSHLYAGATLLLTEESVMKEGFWQFFEHESATTFSAVPFTFDVLERLGFRERSYPALRYITQAGGRLQTERVVKYGTWAHESGKRFFVMYGQTEAAPRMAYVPPEQLLDNPECIGLPIPSGAFELRDESGALVTLPNQPGELIYRGPNVMMGYAESATDLASDAGTDELRTGDVACRNLNGLYYIVGRKSRFSKILGLRLSLDEIERWLQQRGHSGIVSGDDRVIAVAVPQVGVRSTVTRSISERFGLPASVIHVVEIDPLPTLPTGKFDYRAVLRLAQDATVHGSVSHRRTLLDSYREVLGTADVRPTDSFLDLGGDSVDYVEVSLLLEEYLGHVPENWEALPVEVLESLKHLEYAPQSQVQSTDPIAHAVAVPNVQRRFWIAATLGMALLIGGEAALQLRAYLKTGRSVLAVVKGDSVVVRNSESGLKTWRPNLDIHGPTGSGRRFQTNSLGFRSPEIRREAAENELRIVVVGASTVAGQYAKANEDTFSSLLERQLRDHLHRPAVNVVNAGIEGYAVHDIAQLIDRTLIGLQPSAVLFYPGFNDMASICRATQRRKRSFGGAPILELPNWVLTRALISKNTIDLREPPVRAMAVDPAEYFPPTYIETLDSIVDQLARAGILPIFVTVARAFKNADPAMRAKLAESALYWNPCLSVDGVLKAGDLFNDALRNVARRHGLPLLDLASAMPGGREYFVDAVHFTAKGERFAADFIYGAIVGDDELSQRLGISPPTH